MSPQFRNELKKAIQLSVFITVIVVGVLIVARPGLEPQRNIANIKETPKGCEYDGEGKLINSHARSVPPFEHRDCPATNH